MAFEGVHLLWKQILLGCYAGIIAVRGALMVLHPRLVLGWMRRTVRHVIAWVFQLAGRTMPRIDHAHQVLAVRLMGVTSLLGAAGLIWWLLR